MNVHDSEFEFDLDYDPNWMSNYGNIDFNLKKTFSPMADEVLTDLAFAMIANDNTPAYFKNVNSYPRWQYLDAS